MLTVFTPTYNRAGTLRRVYESLMRQTDSRFEWIVVDDGSEDETDELMQSLCSEDHFFPIRYIKQLHGGKHRAQNKAIDLADGSWFITCDSNKYLADDAVEWILLQAESVEDCSQICGIGGYRSDFSGKHIGGEIRFGGQDYLDCTTIEREQHNITGDKSTAFKTENLRQYKSPEYENESFATESTWLLQQALDGYQIRWTPHVLIYGEYTVGGLTQQGANSRSGHEKNFKGFCKYVELSIRAYGFEREAYFVREAIEIAKSKKIHLKLLSEYLDVPVHTLRLFRLRMYVHRVIQKLPGFSASIRRLCGEEALDKIRNWIKL